MDKAVIHKVVFDLAAAADTLTVGQQFDVPRNAVLVAVDWDTRAEHGIALWYRFTVPHPGYTGPEYKTRWSVIVAGTGHDFPADAGYLGTAVRGGFAWHLLDADGDHIRRGR